MFIGVSFALIFMASLSISSAYSQEHAITYIYGYSSLLLALIFCATCMTFNVLHNKVHSDFAKECNSKTGIAYQIDQVYATGENIFCSKACPCNVGDNKDAYEGKKYKDFVFSKKGAKQYLDCNYEKMSKTHEKKYVSFLSALENEFDCAGICVQPTHYLFRDLDKADGPPKSTCKDAVIPFIHERYYKYCTFLSIVSVIGFMGVFQAFAVCFQKK